MTNTLQICTLHHTSFLLSTFPLTSSQVFTTVQQNYCFPQSLYDHCSSNFKSRCAYQLRATFPSTMHCHRYNTGKADQNVICLFLSNLYLTMNKILPIKLQLRLSKFNVTEMYFAHGNLPLPDALCTNGGTL